MVLFNKYYKRTILFHCFYNIGAHPSDKRRNNVTGDYKTKGNKNREWKKVMFGTYKKKPAVSISVARCYNVIWIQCMCVRERIYGKTTE